MAEKEPVRAYFCNLIQLDKYEPTQNGKLYRL